MGGNGQASGVNEVRFTIPLAFPSVNALHNIIYSRRRVELKPEVLKWKNDAAVFVPGIKLRSEASIVRVDAVFYYRFYYNNGKWRVFDTHNAVKPLLDLIAAKAGFNDLRVKCGSWDSVDSVDEKVEVVLREVIDNGTHND
jgi:hypothetical protein